MTSASQRGLPGTRPEGVRDEKEAAAHVREMFGRIAPRYDLLNHLLSLDIDKVWRRRVAKEVSRDLARSERARARSVLRHGRPGVRVSQRSAERARRLSAPISFRRCSFARAPRAAASGAKVEFVEADALALPFADASFDLVSCAFGFRNLANYERGIAGNSSRPQARRRGRNPGICRASRENLRRALRFYFRHVLPRLGGLISGDASAYSYLPSSVSKFPVAG